MDNKNKKDMSVDDLVKQLKLVLDINDEDEGKPADVPEEEIIQDIAPDPEETPEPMSAEKAETISDKVKLLDQFFEEEENKKNKKKNRLKSREPKEKKKKKKQDDEDLVISAFDNKNKPEDDLTDEQLTSFADEISDMFSDPEEDQTKAVPELKYDKPEEQPTAVTPDKPTASIIEQLKAPKTVKEPEPEKQSGEDTPKDDAPEFTMEFITPSAAEDDLTSEPDEDISPFVNDALKPDDKGDEIEGEGETKQFSIPYEDASDKTMVRTKEEKVITKKKPEPVEETADIDDFNVFFEDIHPENTDGYTVSEEAIMDAFGEREEKPEKNPVKSKNDLSISNIEEEPEPEEEEKKAAAAGFDEFTSYDQRKTFLETFKKKFLSLKVSIVLSSIFAALVFIYECLSFAGDKFPQFCSPAANPSVFILIDLQLFAICAIFGVNYVISGIKGLFTGKANICSLGALSVIITFIYGILAAVTANPTPHPVMSASALCVVLMLTAEYRCVKRDTLNFRIISGTPAKPKFVMETYTPGKNSAEEKEFYDYVPENASMLRVSKTNFVRGFVTSNLKSSASKGYINLMFPVIALIFAAVLAVVLIWKKDMSAAVNAAYTASALCMPAAVFTAVTLPSFSGAKKTYSDDSCIISEAAAEQYSDASVVTFEDSDVFPPSLDRITSVRLYNDSRMDHIMYVLTSLFRKIGGPLLTICENAAKEYNEFSQSVTIDNAVENGIEATVDAQKVFLGSALYMGSKLDPKYRTDDRQYENNEKSRIMYMIINDVVAAKFYIEYEMDKDFVSVIKQLSTSTRCVAIRTLDPNIDTKLIRSYLDTDIYHCKIIRSRDNERRTKVSKSSRGAVVSKNSIKALLRSLMLCDKMVYSSKINMIICFLSVIIGLIFSVFMIVTKTSSSINVLHVIGYQLLLCIVIRLVTKINI